MTLFVLSLVVAVCAVCIDKTSHFSKVNNILCFAGLCTMIAISWYAANITQEFFDQFYPGTK